MKVVTLAYHNIGNVKQNERHFTRIAREEEQVGRKIDFVEQPGILVLRNVSLNNEMIATSTGIPKKIFSVFLNRSCDRTARFYVNRDSTTSSTMGRKGSKSEKIIWLAVDS